jgi:hypothetical protein
LRGLSAAPAAGAAGRMAGVNNLFMQVRRKGGRGHGGRGYYL